MPAPDCDNRVCLAEVMCLMVKQVQQQGAEMFPVVAVVSMGETGASH